MVDSSATGQDQQPASQLVARTMTGQDQCVMETANDALTTKVYAQKMGYFTDEFVGLFARNSKKMFPIINRGTWARVYAVRQMLQRFLAKFDGVSRVNIVSLGAGLDSTYFWLKKNQPDIDAKLDYIEIDFEHVIKRKTAIIKDKPTLSELVQWRDEQATLGAHEIETDSYKLFASDVRDGAIITQKLRSMGVDPALPTFILTECLLIYMRPEDTALVHDWTMDMFGAEGDLVYLNYEMITPNDQFGRMMVENLENRGCQLLGIHDCPTLEAQKQRMQDLTARKGKHLVRVQSESMNTVYAQKLNAEGEKTRIERIEMFDEFEEWELLQSHYCLTLAVCSAAADSESPLVDLSL